MLLLGPQKAFSMVRRRVPPVKPLGGGGGVQEVPMWHSIFLPNDHGHTYWCTRLIRHGVISRDN